jgi:hypothetical protein
MTIEPCPWCDNGDFVSHYEIPTGHYVCCEGCAANGPHVESEVKAIEQWNRIAVTRKRIEAALLKMNSESPGKPFEIRAWRQYSINHIADLLTEALKG